MGLVCTNDKTLVVERVEEGTGNNVSLVCKKVTIVCVYIAPDVPLIVYSSVTVCLCV